MTDPQHTYLVVGPPRSASTALSRVIWNHPGVRYYSHEPYESAYFKGLGTTEADAAMRHPIDLSAVVGAKAGTGLLVKEISFQLGERLPHLLTRTAHPVVFLLRDPRLAIDSRRRVRERQGRPLDFPLAETGWQALVEQIGYCQANDIPHLVLDSFDFRVTPAPIFERMFAAWGLAFDESQLSWEPRPRLELSNYRVGGVDHFFTRVLNSTGLELPVEVPLPVADFPETGGLRDHVRWALEQYERLRQGRQFVPTGAGSART
ncbi:hypothetical protein [Amycolatopsis solani]|uniref:sulfotransferase-like domain-containing protein n=1 Tax=Amycolatopsis solani TaxID=3028615 RepID=UPI0025B1982B|nr:hypothetical protein [Amycolatopsis sp. MEP2-6]